MATDEGRENRRKARRQHLSTTRGTEAAHAAGAAAATITKQKRKPYAPQFPVRLKTEDGQTDLSLQDGFDAQATGTDDRNMHYQMAFKQLLENGQVYVDQLGTYIQLSCEVVPMHRMGKYFLTNWTKAGVTCKLKGVQCKEEDYPPIFTLTTEDGGDYISSCTWNGKHLSTESKEIFEQRVRELRTRTRRNVSEPTVATAPGVVVAAAFGAADRDEQSDDGLDDPSVATLTKQKSSKARKSKTTTKPPASTQEPAQLKAPPGEASDKVAESSKLKQVQLKHNVVPSRMMDEQLDSPTNTNAPTVAAASGDHCALSEDVADIDNNAEGWQSDSPVPSTVEKTPNQAMASTSTPQKKKRSAPKQQPPPPSAQAGSGELVATSHVDQKDHAVTCGNKTPTKKPRLEVLEGVLKAAKAHQDDVRALGDEPGEPPTFDKKQPGANAPDKKRPPSNTLPPTSVAFLRQSGPGKPTPARKVAVKMEAQDTLSKAGQVSTAGTRVDIVDLTNLDTESESEMKEDAGPDAAEKGQQRQARRQQKSAERQVWLEQKLEILKKNADHKLPFDTQDIRRMVKYGTRALKSDPLLLELNSPIAICGDIHGHFMNMQKAVATGISQAKVRIIST
jgi:hypothetical protein